MRAASNACFTAASDFADTFFAVVSWTAMEKLLATEPAPLAASPVVVRFTVSRSSPTNSSASAWSRTAVSADCFPGVATAGRSTRAGVRR